jgi:quinoprotein glucose dehydrogenase
MKSIFASICVLAVALAAAQSPVVDWSANGRDLEGTRYVPASEITPANVGRLERAWTYRTGESGPAFATTKPAAFEATPLVVDGVMYVGTPLGRAIALDAATGRERWVFDPRIARNIPYGDFASRGVATRPAVDAFSWLPPSRSSSRSMLEMASRASSSA